MMTNVAESFFKALMDRFPLSTFQDAVNEAPLEMSSKVIEMSKIEGKSIQTFFVFPKEVLSRLHPSWFEDVVASCPNSFRPVALRAIEEEIGVAKKTFSDSMRGFLLQEALSLWPESQVKEETNLQLPLFKECSAEDLEVLSGLVSLYGLVSEVRKTVEKKKLQRLFGHLSPLQQTCLKKILQSKKFCEKSSLDFNNFLQQDHKTAAEMLRMNGLRKIGMVLREESSSVFWSVIHRMDKKSAAFIQEGRDAKDLPCDCKQMQKIFIHAFQFVQR